jgi:hypothetical protein
MTVIAVLLTDETVPGYRTWFGEPLRTSPLGSHQSDLAARSRRDPRSDPCSETSRERSQAREKGVPCGRGQENERNADDPDDADDDHADAGDCEIDVVHWISLGRYVTRTYPAQRSVIVRLRDR